MVDELESAFSTGSEHERRKSSSFSPSKLHSKGPEYSNERAKSHDRDFWLHQELRGSYLQWRIFCGLCGKRPNPRKKIVVKITVFAYSISWSIHCSSDNIS